MTHFLFLSTSEWLFLGSMTVFFGTAGLLIRYKDNWLSKIPFMNSSEEVYRITFDDNFHNFASSERYTVTVSGGSRKALREAKRAINCDLRGMKSDRWWISPNELWEGPSILDTC